MKNIIYILPFILFSASACNFLDIDTPGIVDKNEMFKDDQGFIDAMNGVYASMTKEDLYGGKLSFSFVDEIAQLYYNEYVSHKTDLDKVYDLDYMDDAVRAQIDAIWKEAYNVIALTNAILENMPKEENQTKLTKQIKAEALTVRAFLHFEILSLFAYETETTNEEISIPYVETFSNTPTERISIKKVYECVLRDLKTAKEILSDESNTTERKPKELYINLNTVNAILARVSLAQGNKSAAEQYALEVLSTQEYNLAKEEALKNLFLGYLAKTECIWGLHSPKVYYNMRSIMYPYKMSENINIVRENFIQLYNVSSFTAFNNDYRYQSFFSRGHWNGATLLSKLYDKNYDEFNIPSGRIVGINLIRLPEIYYILAEAIYEKDREQALYFFNKVVVSRGLSPIKLEAIISFRHLQKILAKEIAKEYWGEGRIFISNKRLQIEMQKADQTIIPVTSQVYKLPLPNDEYAFGIN